MSETEMPNEIWVRPTRFEGGIEYRLSLAPETDESKLYVPVDRVLLAMGELLKEWEEKPTEDFDDRQYRGGGIDALKQAITPRIIDPSLESP